MRVIDVKKLLPVLLIFTFLSSCASEPPRQYYSQTLNDPCEKISLSTKKQIVSMGFLVLLSELEITTLKDIKEAKGLYDIENYYQERDKLINYIDNNLGKYSYCSEDIVKKVDELKAEVKKLDEKVLSKVLRFQKKREDELLRKQEREEQERILNEIAQRRLNRLNDFKGKGYPGLSYKDENISLEITNFQVYNGSTYFELKLIVVSKSKIIKPRTYRVFGFEDGSDIGGSAPTGIKLFDNFGNKFDLKEIEPHYFGQGFKEIGIKPNESKIFKIQFMDKPLDNTVYLILKISRQSFDNSKEIEIKIPYSIITG